MTSPSLELPQQDQEKTNFEEDKDVYLFEVRNKDDQSGHTSLDMGVSFNSPCMICNTVKVAFAWLCDDNSPNEGTTRRMCLDCIFDVVVQKKKENIGFQLDPIEWKGDF